MTTRWFPDTCDCVIEYDDPKDMKLIKPCGRHKTAEEAKAENIDKNTAEAE